MIRGGYFRKKSGLGLCIIDLIKCKRNYQYHDSIYIDIISFYNEKIFFLFAPIRKFINRDINAKNNLIVCVEY